MKYELSTTFHFGVNEKYLTKKDKYRKMTHFRP